MSDEMANAEGSANGPETAPANTNVPYVSLKTLDGLLDKIGAGPIPPRIDKGFLDSYSGGTQAILKVALRALGLINEDETKTDLLESVATDKEVRKEHFRGFLDRTYSVQNQLAAKNGTSQQLEESFAAMGFKGPDTRRKAIVFYLNLVDYVGGTKSPYFKPPRQAAAAARKAKQRKPQPSTPGQTHQDDNSTGSSSGNRVIVKLGSVGTITLVTDLRWMDLTPDQRNNVFGVIDKVKALGLGAPPAPDVDEGDEAEDEDEEADA